MKAAPSDRSIPKLRPLRSLYSDNAAPGKRDAASIKLMDKKRIFKPHQNTQMFRKSIGVPAKIGERHTRARINSKDSTRVSRGTNLAGATGKSQLNGMFLRPPIDVRSFHKKIMERARQLDETLQTDEGQSKDLNHIIIKLPSSGACWTPKPSGLSRAYIKLSESLKKTCLLIKGCPSGTFSPFEERIIQKEASEETSKVPDKNQENIMDTNSFTHSKISSGDAKVKENDSACMVVSNAEQSPKKGSSNIDKEVGNNVSDENNGNRTLSNILKHCQLYSDNMMNIQKAMSVLDETFQRVMVGEIGSHLRARFCDYQNGKLQLYKKMELLEEELEKSIKNDVDIPSKFNEYLATRRNIMKERRDLQENFENFINQMIQNYDKEMGKPPECEKLEDVMKGLVSGKVPHLVKRAEPTLRRSQRLLTPPRISDAEAKDGATLSRRSTTKEELVKKRRSKSYDKKSVQRRIYKDLQKSCNLCSPECSF